MIFNFHYVNLCVMSVVSSSGVLTRQGHKINKSLFELGLSDLKIYYLFIKFTLAFCTTKLKFHTIIFHLKGFFFLLEIFQVYGKTVNVNNQAWKRHGGDNR